MSKKQTLGDVTKDFTSGTVTLNPPIDDELPEVTTEAPSRVSLDADAVVMVPPLDEEEMEEISAENVVQRRAVNNPTPVATLSSIVNGLVGQSLPEVRAALEELRVQGRIKEFKIVPIGMPMASNAIPGRIQVVKDHADNVLDIVVG